MRETATAFLRRGVRAVVALQVAGVMAGFAVMAVSAEPVTAARRDPGELVVPAPRPATRPATRPVTRPVTPSSKPTVTQPVDKDAEARRRAAIGAVRSWGYQLAGLRLPDVQKSPYDLLVVDATTGLAEGRHFRPDEVARLQKTPRGTRRLVASYLSIGEAEDYRPDYFSREYLEEDAPDWLMSENPQWRGNRIIRFCDEGWQRTILGDDDGRNVYNAVEPSPLNRLIELGFDGVYLDRVDVYGEVAEHCPDAERRMVDFVARLARHARKTKPDFLVILQNAEELLRHPRMIEAIDAIAKEDLFYGNDHSQRANDPVTVRDTLANLRRAKSAGRPVFVVDYVRDPKTIATARRRIEAEGFIGYIGPRDLQRLWLPGIDF